MNPNTKNDLLKKIHELKQKIRENNIKKEEKDRMWDQLVDAFGG